MSRDILKARRRSHQYIKVPVTMSQNCRIAGPAPRIECFIQHRIGSLSTQALLMADPAMEVSGKQSRIAERPICLERSASLQ